MAVANHYLPIVLQVMLGAIGLLRIGFFKPTKMLGLRSSNPVCDVILDAACYIQSGLSARLFEIAWSLEAMSRRSVT